MSYTQMEHTFNLLTDEQQQAIFNLAVLMLNSNSNAASKPQKRTFGQYAGRATAVFADDWEMTDEELCSL